MSLGVDNLPDFSKGEELGSPSTSAFQPLFGEPVETQTWTEDAPMSEADSCDDLAALVSELGQLPVEPVEAEAASPVDVSPEPEVEEVEPVPSVSQEEHDAAIEALRQEHAQEIERLQAEHKGQVLQHLENMQHGIVDDLANRIELELATSLAPLFQKDVARNSLEQLVAEVKRLIQSEAVERIQLSGPSTLATAASMALAGSSLKIDVETTDTPDLLVHLNNKILSTSIGDWSRQVEEALGK